MVGQLCLTLDACQLWSDMLEPASRLTRRKSVCGSYRPMTTPSKDVGCRSNFDPSRPLYTQDTSFSVKSSLTAVRQGAKVPSSDIFDSMTKRLPYLHP